MALIIPVPSTFIRHDNHIPPASFTQRIFAQRADFLLIRNLGPEDIQISFDGTNGFTVKNNESMTFELNNRFDYYTKSSSGTPTLEVMVGSDQ